MKGIKLNSHGTPAVQKEYAGKSVGKQTDAPVLSSWFYENFGITPNGTSENKGAKVIPNEPWIEALLDEEDAMIESNKEAINYYESQFKSHAYKVKIFNSSLSEILDSINNNTKLEGVDLSKKIRDPNFRFLSKIDPEDSYKLTQSYAGLIANVKTELAQKASKASVAKRQESADEFAKRMKDVVDSVKVKTGSSSQRAIIKALNDNGITAHRGGKWHKGTLQELYKRWNSLGLDS
jgi:hypothetical protein